MSRNQFAVALVAVLVVLAGCSGGTAGGPATDATGAPDGTVAGDGGGQTGTVNFYLSDDPGVIDQFEHLNVTVTKIGLKRAGGANGSSGDDANATATRTANATATETPNATSTPNGTESGNGTSSAGAAAGASGAGAVDATGTNESDTPERTDGANETDAPGDGPDDGDADERDGEGNETEAEGDGNEAESDAGWVEYEVDQRTIDLTTLVGPNATRLRALDAPAGTYEKVFVHITAVEGVLKDGTEVNVKLPSEKLQIDQRFTVGDGETVDFVFDITVFEAGKSGKYILKPVVSQSGTGADVEIEDVGNGDAGNESAGQGDGAPAGDAGNATDGGNETEAGPGGEGNGSARANGGGPDGNETGPPDTRGRDAGPRRDVRTAADGGLLASARLQTSLAVEALGAS